MTVLSVCQSFATVIGTDVPTDVMSSTDREHIEMAALAKRSARRLFKAYDWELLTRLGSFAGDGSTTAFDLPSDYDRMPKKQEMRSDRIFTPLTHIVSQDTWLDLQINVMRPAVAQWIKIGGQVLINPAPTATETIQFYYISNLWAQDSGGTAKATFNSDDDEFRLDEDLLELEMIWQWKANKGLPYAEDMANLEERLAKDVMRDKGSRTIRIGRPHRMVDASVAYPQSIVDS